MRCFILHVWKKTEGEQTMKAERRQAGRELSLSVSRWNMQGYILTALGSVHIPSLTTEMNRMWNMDNKLLKALLAHTQPKIKQYKHLDCKKNTKKQKQTD